MTSKRNAGAVQSPTSLIQEDQVFEERKPIAEHLVVREAGYSFDLADSGSARMLSATNRVALASRLLVAGQK
jgi:hypothetical protein